MFIRTLNAAALAALAISSAIALSASPASADTCDGTWQQSGLRVQKQCYYLPTVSNGRVTGVELKTNYRLNPPKPGAIVGGAGHQTPGHYHPGSK